MPRGQAAIEFITTYGWAVLLVIVLIGALAYFGVVRPDTYVPERCDVSNGFSCGDFLLAMPGPGSEVEIELGNALGKTVQLQQALIEYETQSGDSLCGRFHDTPGVTSPDGSTTHLLAPGKKVYVTCNVGAGHSIGFLKEGEKALVKFSMNFTYEGFTLLHQLEGQIVGTIQP